MQYLCKDDERREQTRQRVAAYRARKKAVQDMVEKLTEKTTKPVLQDETMSYTQNQAESPEKVPQTVNGTKDNKTRDIQRPTINTTSPAVAYYQKNFGPALELVASHLVQLEDIWPLDTIIAAIDVAKYRGRGNIHYIEKIIENSMSPENMQRWEQGEKDVELRKCLAKFRQKELEWDRKRAIRELRNKERSY